MFKHTFKMNRKGSEIKNNEVSKILNEVFVIALDGDKLYDFKFGSKDLLSFLRHLL